MWHLLNRIAPNTPNLTLSRSRSAFIPSTILRPPCWVTSATFLRKRSPEPAGATIRATWSGRPESNANTTRFYRDRIDPKPGHDLRLTIDLNLQLAAEQAMGGRAGAVVALDPRNGEVLAMVSQPTFDPNEFAHHIDLKTWKQLNSDPEKPLMNEAIQAQLAPGSVFKIVTAVAGLETGTIHPNYTVNCPGYATFYGHTYHDWSWVHHRGHGVVDLHRAI